MVEVSRLSSDLRYVEINGVTINLEERSRIDLACMQLSSDVNEGTIYFWGKIRGKCKFHVASSQYVQSKRI